VCDAEYFSGRGGYIRKMLKKHFIISKEMQSLLNHREVLKCLMV
jgi:hypothetical protein